MKFRSIFQICLIFTSVLLFSCKKDIKQEAQPEPTGTTLAIPAATPISGSLRGMVLDENNQPLNGAVVHAGTNTITTDARGMFSFINISLDKYISTVTVNKTGYFKSIRSFSATAAVNYVTIKLLPKTLSGTFNSANGE